MKKHIAFFSILALMALGLSGCNQQEETPELPVPPVAELPGEPLEMTIQTYENPLPSNVWDSIPSVVNVTENSFVLLTGGSSSCPNTIANIFKTEPDTILIVYTASPEGKKVACTADFELQPVQVDFAENVITPGTTTFELMDPLQVENIPLPISGTL